MLGWKMLFTVVIEDSVHAMNKFLFKIFEFL